MMARDTDRDTGTSWDIGTRLARSWRLWIDNMACYRSSADAVHSTGAWPCRSPVLRGRSR